MDSPTLSIHRSFVVRIYADRPGRGEISGQVEHIVSGEAAEFLSIKELLRFFDRLCDRPTRVKIVKENSRTRPVRRHL